MFFPRETGLQTRFAAAEESHMKTFYQILREKMGDEPEYSEVSSSSGIYSENYATPHYDIEPLVFAERFSGHKAYGVKPKAVKAPIFSLTGVIRVFVRKNELNDIEVRAWRALEAFSMLDFGNELDFDSLKKVYRRLCLELHPDQSGHAGSASDFQQMREAYVRLEKVFKRKKNDAASRTAADVKAA